MIIDGRKIAQEIQEQLRREVAARKSPPVVAIVSVGNDPVMARYLSIKKRFAEAVGVGVRHIQFPDSAKEAAILDAIAANAVSGVGIIVQLPLPKTLNKERIVNAIPAEHDPDMLSSVAFEKFEKGATALLPPVTGAFKEILKRHAISLKGKNVVVAGRGQLVGKPTALWCEQEGATVSIVDDRTDDIATYAKNADIIFSGAGVAGLFKPEMIKNGAVILDAGTSEQGGKIVGDADPSCAEKAALFTPTPGGVGPVTVAVMFRNLVMLTSLPAR